MPAELPSILQKIVDHKRGEVAERKARVPRPAVDAAPPVRDFLAALRSGPRIALIAEVKPASPTRGVMRADIDPPALGRTYWENGAAAISVLTDEQFFHGHDRNLTLLREICPIPLLRKEFLLDPWQIEESRALGADAVLLIVAILSDVELRQFLAHARQWGMAALVEAHTEEELQRALATDAALIGINNRNLHTFETTLATTERLAASVKRAGRLFVSESGICNRADLDRLAPHGVDAVLVGEALIREADVAAKVRELSAASRKC
jgi:indole-3-glycerol phosphate synthase